MFIAVLSPLTHYSRSRYRAPEAFSTLHAWGAGSGTSAVDPAASVLRGERCATATRNAAGSAEETLGAADEQAERVGIEREGILTESDIADGAAADGPSTRVGATTPMIQQERARSAEELAEAADLYFALGRITRLLRRSGDLGSLSPGSAAALGTLVRSGPMRLGDLAAAEHVTAPTMSRIVSGLEKYGYLERTADPADGRAQLLTVTEQAKSLVNGLTSARIQRFAAALDDIDPQQRRTLGDALAVLVARLDDDGSR